MSEATGDAATWTAKLAPFRRELSPPGGAPMWLEGRIDAGRYRLIAERRGQRYEVELSERVERGAAGSVAQVEPGTRPLGPGLWVSLEPVADGGGARRGAALLLRVETRSAAYDRGGAVLDRLGGGPALARLLSPPRWSATLRFDAAGEPVRESGHAGLS